MSRADRRHAARIRRNRTLLICSVALSAAIVGAWFPLGDLLSQHRQLVSIDAQVSQLRQQDHALSAEQRMLSQPQEIGRLAQQEYQLVRPGQTAYQVLPPNGSAHGGSFGGDPAYQPLVSPSAASEIPAGSSVSESNRPAGSAGRSSAEQGAKGRKVTDQPSGLLNRIFQTLEFWR